MKVQAQCIGLGRPQLIALTFMRERERVEKHKNQDSYRDMVDQSCDTVTKVMHVLGARLSPKSSSYVDTSATKSQSSRRSV